MSEGIPPPDAALVQHLKAALDKWRLGRAIRHDTTRWLKSEFARHRPHPATGVREFRLRDHRNRRWLKCLRKCGNAHSSWVRISQSPMHGGAHLDGLTQCKNRWFCGYCSHAFRSQIALSTAATIRGSLPDFWEWSMVTLTISHHHGDTFDEVHADLRRAWSLTVKRQSLKAHSPAIRRALDITVGGPSGPHPHYGILIGTRLGDHDAAVAALKESWSLSAQTTGRTVNPAHGTHSVRIRPHEIDALSHYTLNTMDVTKAGFEAFDQTSRRSRVGRSIDQLLHDSASGDRHAQEWLIQLEKSLKGVRSVSSNTAWLDLARKQNIEEISEDDHITDGAQGDNAIWVTAQTWNKHRGTMCSLLDALGNHLHDINTLAWTLQTAEIDFSRDPPAEVQPGNLP